MTFEIRPRGDMHPHLPVQIMDGMQTSTDIEVLTDPSSSRRVENDDMWEPGQRRIGGYFLPPFQRPLEWTTEQKERLVESALLGISIGSIVVVDAINCPMPSPDRFARTDRWLIDGQQRCNALIEYRQNNLTVFRGTQCEHRWEDLTVHEQRRFWRTQIGVIKVRTDDVAYCAELYNRLNFGGTAHREDQRAKVEDYRCGS